MKFTRVVTLLITVAGFSTVAAPASATSLPEPHPELTHKLDGKVHGSFPDAPHFKLPANAERAPRVKAKRSDKRPKAPEVATRRPKRASVSIDGWEGTLNQKLPSVLSYVRNYYGRTISNFYQPTVYRDAASYTFTCGGRAASVQKNAIFCSSPYYVALDTDWLSGYNSWSRGGDTAWAIIVAHEFGHAAQHNLGLNQSNTPNLRWTIYGELFADCMAGSWAGDLQRRGRLDNIAPGDYAEAVNAMYSLGDAAGTPWYQEGAHGSAALRRTYMDYGWRYGAQACVNWIRS